MTAPVDDLKVGPAVLANGVSTINLDFFVEDEALLEVTVSSQAAPLVLATDYTFAGEGTATGVVTLTTPANGSDSYAVRLVPTLGRTTDIAKRGDFRSEVWNLEMDRLWRAIQYLSTQLTGGTFLFTQDSDIPDPLQTITDAGRIGKVLGFTGDGTGLALSAGADNLTVPGGSTDNAIVRWSGANANELQNAGAILDDSNNLSGLGTVLATRFATGAATSALALATGTTAQRPTAAVALLRNNSDNDDRLEHVDGSGAWKAILAAPSAQLLAGRIPYMDANARVAMLAPGTAGQVLTMGASLPAWGTPTTGIAAFNYEESGTPEDFQTSYDEIPLNTTEVAGLGITLASEQLTFSTAGTYLALAWASFSNTSGGGRFGKLRLYNTTQAAVAAQGGTQGGQTAADYFLQLMGAFTVSASDVLEFQGIANSTGVGIGQDTDLGGAGVDHAHAGIIIWRVS